MIIIEYLVRISRFLISVLKSKGRDLGRRSHIFLAMQPAVQSEESNRRDNGKSIVQRVKLKVFIHGGNREVLKVVEGGGRGRGMSGGHRCSSLGAGSSKNTLRVTCQDISVGPSAVRPILTAHAPATDATIDPEIIIGLTPLVLLNSMPLSPPATILLAASCLPRHHPRYELIPL
jgi:hypothetical protein